MKSSGQIALLEVTHVHPRVGCFLESGPGQSVLLPISELPEAESLRPQAGDWVYVVKSLDKFGRMVGRAVAEEDLKPLAMHAPDSWRNRWFEVRVYNPLPIGAFVLCQDEEDDHEFGAIGFIHESECTRIVRLGEQVRARVAFIREDGRVNLSMRPLKEHGRDQDAERILALLQASKNGALPYSDQTPADIIQSKFNISKSAFKRAMGKLMKEGIVVQEGNWTRLKEGCKPDRMEGEE